MGNPDPASAAPAGLIDVLRELPQRVGDAVRIDRIRLLEELKAAAAAAQAVETAAFAASQRCAQRAAGVPETRVGRGVAAQVGLARRMSPHQAARYLGWATILVTELPNTFTALASGRVAERRAEIVARETIWLAREQRLAVDAELAPQLSSLGDRRLEAEARRIGYRLDPHGFVNRRAKAEAERRVWLRPAPEAMVYLTALLPVAQGAACHAALSRAADTSTAVGDERGRGQLMADTLVRRLTGQVSAPDVPVAINLLITDGGPTSVANGQGYCETCNHTKQAPGWATRAVDNDDGVHEVETTTPTGHVYRSRAPDPPGRNAA